MSARWSDGPCPGSPSAESLPPARAAPRSGRSTPSSAARKGARRREADGARPAADVEQALRRSLRHDLEQPSEDSLRRREGRWHPRQRIGERILVGGDGAVGAAPVAIARGDRLRPLASPLRPRPSASAASAWRRPSGSSDMGCRQLGGSGANRLVARKSWRRIESSSPLDGVVRLMKSKITPSCRP